MNKYIIYTNIHISLMQLIKYQVQRLEDNLGYICAQMRFML